MTPQRTARETKSIILNNVVIFNGKEESTVRGSVRIDGNRIRTGSTEPIGSDRDRPVEVIDGQGKFLMPGLIFLPHIFDVHTRWDGSWGVWCAMPLSDLMASVVAFFMLVYQLRKFRAQMDAARSTNLQ